MDRFNIISDDTIGPVYFVERLRFTSDEGPLVELTKDHSRAAIFEGHLLFVMGIASAINVLFGSRYNITKIEPDRRAIYTEGKM